MKTLVNIFVLLIVVSLSALSQQKIQTENGWNFAGAYGYLDSTQTRSYETSTGSQVFKSYGETGGDLVFQTTWSKDFKNLLMPDTISIDLEFLKGVNNRKTTCIFLAVQESPIGLYYFLGKYQPVSSSGEWQRFSWDMSLAKIYNMKSLYRVYLILATETADSITYTGMEVELKNLIGIDSLGVKTYIDLGAIATGVDGVSEVKQVPSGFVLEQNYPNPFNPDTRISYSLKNAGKVHLSVFNMLGQEVAVLVNGTQNIGAHEATFNASNLPSGVYLCRLAVDNNVITKKMLLLK